MDVLDTAKDMVPVTPVAIIGRAADALDLDLTDLAADIVDVAGDVVDVAGEGIVAAVAATEVASQATVGFIRRHPLAATAVAAALIAAIALMIGKRRKDAGDTGTASGLHAAA